MPAYPFNPGLFYWTPPRPHASGSFRPMGRITRHGSDTWLHNPSDWESAKTIAARLIVGFSVGQDPKYSMEDLIPIVARVREAQTGNQSASFIAQRGIYQHHDGTTVTEDGAQVFIINLTGVTMRKFKAQIVELAETIARELQQESVIVEIQVNGLSKVTIGVSP